MEKNADKNGNKTLKKERQNGEKIRENGDKWQIKMAKKIVKKRRKNCDRMAKKWQ